MNLKYKIISIDTTQHSIVVRYYTDIITEAMLATDTLEGVIRSCRTDYSIDLPIPAPTGLGLSEFISARAPITWLETQETILNLSVDTSLANIIPLVNIETTIQTQLLVAVGLTTIPVTTI